MIYLTKQQLIDRINIWLKYDNYTWQLMKLLNIEDTPDAIADLEWVIRNDLIKAIILHEMHIEDLNHMRAIADEIEAFEMYCEFDGLIFEAQKDNHSAEWVYDRLIEEWYKCLQEAADAYEIEDTDE